MVLRMPRLTINFPRIVYKHGTKHLHFKNETLALLSNVKLLTNELRQKYSILHKTSYTLRAAPTKQYALNYPGAFKPMIT